MVVLVMMRNGVRCWGTHPWIVEAYQVPLDLHKVCIDLTTWNSGCLVTFQTLGVDSVACV